MTTPRHRAPLDESAVEAALTRGAEAQADEHLAAAVSRFGTQLGHAYDEREDADRRTVVARFNAIPRTPDYRRAWNRAGRAYGTQLWRAACRQTIAEFSDELFRSSLKHGAVAGIPDGRLIARPVGLAALADQCERDWRRAHLAALGKVESSDA